jgi:uncharacterized protein DUF4167
VKKTTRPKHDAQTPQAGQARNAARSHERYVALARDAAARGDEVGMENFYQHAEHFFRVMTRSEQNQGFDNAPLTSGSRR